MDLTTKRCGCGAIYRASVRTQAECDACGQRQRQEARAQLVAAGRSGDALDDLSQGGRTFTFKEWEAPVLQKGTVGSSAKLENRRAAKDPHAWCPLVVLSGDALDRLGEAVGIKRGFEAKAVEFNGSYAVYRHRETDQAYRERLRVAAGGKPATWADF